MKKLAMIILVLALSANISFAQTAVDKVKSAVDNKEYLEAASYIPEIMKSRDNREDHDIMFLCGNVYYELDKIDSAKICYALAVEADDDQPASLRKYAMVLAELNQFDEAYELIEDAIDEDKDDANNYLTLGNIYILHDSLKVAKVKITKAKGMDPDNPEAYISLGNLYFAEGVYELSKNNYEEALSLDESNIQARIKLATSYYWLANREADADMRNELFGKSIAEWNRISKEDPKNAKAFYEQGRMLYYAKQYGKAASALNKYVELRPDGAQGRWFLAQSLYEVRECDTAEIHLKWVAENIDSVKLKSQLLLARCYHDKKDFDRSKAQYTEIKMNNELELPDLQNLALASLFSGDTLLAVDYFTEFLTKDPTKCKIADLMSKLVIFKIKDYEKAHFFTTKLIENCEDRKANGYFLDGMAYFLAEKSDSACMQFAKSIELDPENLKTKLYFADALVAQDLKDSSVIIYTEVIDIAKQDTTNKEYKSVLGQAFSKLASLYQSDKQYAKLKKTTEMWTEYYPESEFAWLYRAISHQGLNDQPGACKYYKMVLKVNPKNKFAKDFRQKLQCP